MAAHPLAVQGQHLRCITYDIEQGLPTNLTKAVLQDEAGFTWIATDDGLVRFDGRHFLTFTEELPSRYVKSLFHTADGNLLVVTDMGISVIKQQQAAVTFAGFLPARGEHTDSTLFFPKAVYQDRAGTLWISEPDGVVRYRERRLRRYRFAEKYRTDSYFRSFSLVEDRWGRLLAASETGHLSVYNPARDAFLPIPVSGKQGRFTVDALVKLPDGRIWAGGSDGIFELIVSASREHVAWKKLYDIPQVSCFAQDDDGDLYIGTWQTGLYLLRLSQRATAPEKFADLRFPVINHLSLAGDRSLWVSSDTGIALVQPTFFSRMPLPLASPYILMAADGGDGSMVVTEGRTIFKISPKNGRFSQRPIFNRQESLILSLAASGQTVWAGYRDGFVTLHEGGRVSKIELPPKGNRLVTFLKLDRRSQLWVCVDGLTGAMKVDRQLQIKHYEQEHGLGSHLNVIKEDKDGVLYGGGVGNESYLFRYDAAPDSFVNLSRQLPFVPRSPLEVHDLDVGKGGTVWMATNHGLLAYQNGVVRQADGLSEFQNQVIKAVAVDSFQNVWLGTEHGIICYANRQAARFDGKSEFASATVSFRSAVIDDQQRLWVGTSNGFCYWQAPINEKRTTPKVVFLSLQMNHHEADEGATPVPRYPNDSYLTASYAALSYPAEKVLYQTRIPGLDPGWSEPSSRSEVICPRLPEGSYALQVRAQQVGAMWSEVKEFHFTILPPWYKTWWAHVLYTVLLAGPTLAVLRHRLARREHRRTRAALQKSRERFEVAIQGSKDGLWDWDLATDEVFFAPRWKRMLGYADHEIDNRLVELTSRLHPEDRGRVRYAIADYLERRTPDYEIEFRMAHKDGSYRWILARAVALRDTAGRAYRMAGSHTDITALKRVEQELREALEKEKELGQLKSRFVSMASHEFRTPLTAILAASDLLRRYGHKMSEAEKIQRFDRIQAEVAHMTQLLNDVLTYGKADAGKMDFKPSALEVNKLCRQLTDEMQSTAADTHTIAFAAADPIEPIIADEKLLCHILTNLLGNAIKYSPNGSVVHFDLAQNNGRTIFSVQDEGIGIPRDDQKRLFEPFHRAQNVGAIPGTGLGLAIVKKSVERHGGTITVDSDAGAGTTFTVTIPSTQASE